MPMHSAKNHSLSAYFDEVIPTCFRVRFSLRQCIIHKMMSYRRETALQDAL